ncbi:hypothetical protein F5X96DRAFT_655330 [Biscogniauxia mediterranea]|nr:hypothetical protein F5X96DRAFT_655330 [Biscogniauxia mediterranea]
MASTYDFIIVGSGPAGCAVAAGLANAAKKPKVLLLEAGGENADKSLRVDGQRWVTFQNQDMNWGYKTAPQEHCVNREIDYSRGKGLGGTSAINFGVFSWGARDDYEEWARIVGDDTFKWEPIQARFKSLETFHRELPPGIDPKYAAPKESDHGSSGPLQIGFAAEWEEDLPPLLDIFDKAGFPLNPDHNSGNPLGTSVLINSAVKGVRSTAKDLITPTPKNLTVVTNAPVQRVILEGKRAVGVESNGKKYFASKEVVLSAGALNTPQILMHSGIGPRAQLEQFSIPVAVAQPAVGQGLRDHMFSPLVYRRREGSTARASFYGDPAAMEAALAQWRRDGTGPWSKFACEIGIGWYKLPGLEATAEFAALPPAERAFLSRPTVPHFEIATHFPIHWFIPGFPPEDLDCLCIVVFHYNAQARGQVTLQSADPDAPLRFDPCLLGTPFDRRVAVDAMREALKVTRHPDFARDTVGQIAGPAGDSDEELLEYWRQSVGSSWHMTGTAKMGKRGDPDAVVDADFRVLGLEGGGGGLRVADMSVVPVLPSCHIQAVAYVTGATCAEKLVREYGLGETEGEREESKL